MENRHELAPLRKIYIFVNSDCNLNCDYCFINKDKAYLSNTGLTKIISQIDKIGLCQNPRIILYGGEPTLKPSQLSKIISTLEKKYAAKKPKFSLITNGLILTEELTNIIKQYHISVTVSIDGDFAQNNQRIKTWPEFKVLLSNIKKLLRITNVAASVTVTKSNISDIISVFDYIKSLGIKKIGFDFDIHNVYDLKNFIGERQMDYILKVFFEESVVIHPVLDLFFRYLLSNPKTTYCGILKDIAAFDTSGNLLPCHLFKDSHKDTKYLTNIKQEILDHYCSSCPAKQICGGGCIYSYIVNKEHFLSVCGFYNSLLKIFKQYENKVLIIDNFEIISPGTLSGKITKNLQEAEQRIFMSEIITPEMSLDLLNAKGFIVTKGGLLSHIAIYSRELGVPAVKITEKDFHAIPTGSQVKLYDNKLIFLK